MLMLSARGGGVELDGSGSSGAWRNDDAGGASLKTGEENSAPLKAEAKKVLQRKFSLRQFNTSANLLHNAFTRKSQRAQEGATYRKAKQSPKTKICQRHLEESKRHYTKLCSPSYIRTIGTSLGQESEEVGEG